PRPPSGANAPELCPTLSRSLPRKVRLSVGAGGFTVKPAARTPDWPSGFVAVTSRGPGAAAPASVSAAEICVAETTVVEFTVMPAPKETLAPVWKLAPAIVTVRQAPCTAPVGVTLETDGTAGSVTVATDDRTTVG